MATPQNQEGEDGQGQGEVVHHGVDDVAGLEDHQDAPGQANHHTGHGDVGEALGIQLADFVGTPAHDEGAEEAHDDEDSGQLGKVPAIDLAAIDDSDDAAQQDEQDQLFPNAEGGVLHVVFAHGDVSGLAVDQALAGVGLDLQGITDGEGGAHH